MKTYNEMADEVFRRRDEFVKEQKKKRKRIALSVSCLCMAVLVGVGVWQSGVLDPKVQQAEDAIYPEIKDTYGPDEEEPTESKNDVFQSNDEVTVTENKGKVKIISAYEDGGSAAACYALPKNGTSYCSVPLNRAFEAYGDKVDDTDVSVVYGVVVRVFEDGKLVSGKDKLSEIAEKFYELGYEPAIEITNDDPDTAVLTMLVTEAELKEMEADEENGYFFFLRDEADGLGGITTEAIPFCVDAFENPTAQGE